MALKKDSPGAKKEPQQSATAREVPVNRRLPEGQRSLYANHFVVQHEDATFTMFFFEARPPLIVGDGEEVRKQMAAVKSVDADCVSRIVMPITQMPAVIEALKENFQKFAARASKMASIIDTANTVKLPGAPTPSADQKADSSKKKIKE